MRVAVFLEVWACCHQLLQEKALRSSNLYMDHGHRQPIRNKQDNSMALQCGIVGLPNVGKSTLFNCLSNAKAQAANFPFCTIEPNVGVITVPDRRLVRLAEIDKPKRVIPTTIEIVDIAGLVKGASKGEGLGNKFLANIRNTHAIIHVLRCFDNGNITHVDGSIDPVRDKGIIDTELQLKDLETIENRLGKTVQHMRIDRFRCFFKRGYLICSSKEVIDRYTI